MKTIYVKTHDFDFLTAVDIPVVRYENGIIVYCNHAGAEEEESISQHYSYEREDVIEWTNRILVCGKCQAWKFADNNEWHDAPYEGINED